MIIRNTVVGGAPVISDNRARAFYGVQWLFACSFRSNGYPLWPVRCTLQLQIYFESARKLWRYCPAWYEWIHRGCRNQRWSRPVREEVSVVQAFKFQGPCCDRHDGIVQKSAKFVLSWIKTDFLSCRRAVLCVRDYNFCSWIDFEILRKYSNFSNSPIRFESRIE